LSTMQIKRGKKKKSNVTPFLVPDKPVAWRMVRCEGCLPVVDQTTTRTVRVLSSVDSDPPNLSIETTVYMNRIISDGLPL
jgi:hypothetical protein